MSRMPIEDIRFGKIDAHNELQELGEDFYLNSFLTYGKYKIKSFMTGSCYFICGAKGTGKTALLKYLECKLSQDVRNLVIPIRFKSQFDDTEKTQLPNVATNIKATVVEDTTVQNDSSYVLMWQVYLINKIIQVADEGEYSLFKNDYNYNTLRKLLKAIYSGKVERIVPRISKGYVKINISSLKGIDAVMKMEIELNERNARINFNKAAKKIIDLFLSLEYDRNPVYVIVDELELSIKNKNAFNRDVKLVRDLVLAVDRMNHIAKDKKFNIKFIASIRNEVINHALAFGYEINKCIEDYGVNIEWYQKGGSYTDSPLLKLIENKIHASEINAGYTKSKNVWSLILYQG